MKRDVLIQFFQASCLLVAVLWATSCKKPEEQAAPTTLVLEPQDAVVSLGPPTTVRLVLQLQTDGRFRVVSATPKRGSVREANIADNRKALLERHIQLVEYIAKDLTHKVLVTGFFLLPMTAVSEFQDLDVETRVRRREEKLSNPTVKVAIPYDPAIATVSFHGLEPDAEAEPKKWKRVSMGEVSLKPKPDEAQNKNRIK